MSLTPFCASAQNEIPVTLKVHKEPIVNVFNQLSKQIHCNFFYDQQTIDDVSLVTVDVKSVSLQTVLNQLTKQTGLYFNRENNTISVSSRQVAPKQGAKSYIVSGTVVDGNGEPIIGASVVEKGTVNGMVTDVNGKFTLTVTSDKAMLEISYIGYKTNMLRHTGQPLTVVMNEDVGLLDEVVVVGYGAQAKVNLTGAVATVSNAELTERPITSISSGLQGMVPGMAVTLGQGRPGQDGATIRIRGVGTLNNSDPYILIDGIESGSMNQVDPNDIESVSILKDAASASIYGSKASNGVILITTKRGKSGRPVLSYSGNVGWQKATGFIERMNSADAAEYYNKALTNNGKSPRFTNEEIQKFRDGSDPYNYPDTDWNKLGYDGSGFIQQHNANISGGNEFVKYMTSLGYLDQNGIMRNCDRHQFNMRSNLDITLSKYFKIRTNMSYINNAYKDAENSYTGGGSDQIIRQINRIAPWIPYKYEDGTYGTISDGNPIAWLDLGQTVGRKNQNFSGVFAVDYNVFEGLTLTAQGSYTSNIQDYKSFVKDIQYNENKYDGPNKLDERTYLWNRTSFDGLLNYGKSFGLHNVKVMLGYHFEKYNKKQTYATRKGFPNNTLTDLDAGTESTQTNEGYSRELAMMSYFGRINYDYKGKYLLEMNLRTDASSRFSPDNRWGYFPSISAGWRISEESFMEGTRDWLQSLKFRTSWGQLGNQDALDDYYPWLATYSVGKNYPFNGTVATGIAPTTYKLHSITWEKATTWGLGLDFTILNSIDVSIDYYNRKTTGIIMDVPVAGSFGLGAYKDNVGAMRNSGIEANVSYRREWGDWSFHAAGNIAYNQNEILDLGGVIENIDDYKINRVGSAYGSFYTYIADGLFKSQEEADEFTAKYGNPFGKKFMAGDIKYVDVNGDEKLTSADRAVSDAEQPKFTYGLNLSAEWKGIDLAVFMQGAFGVCRYFNEEVYGDFTGDTSHPSTAWFDAWSPENSNGTFPRISEGKTSASHPSIRSSFWLQKTNYLRFKNIQIGYTLPKTWTSQFGISRAKIFYSGENLFKINNLPVNIDPEAASGRGSSYPQVMTNSFGINLTF